MASNEIRITLEIDPIVYLTCAAKECQYNIIHEACCNLKHTWLDENRQCGEYKPRDGAEKDGGEA